MDSAPFSTKCLNHVCQTGADAGQLLPRETVVLTQFRWPVGAMQIEDRFATAAHNMNMRWAMVVRVYHHPQPGKAKDRWHAMRLAQT